MDEIMRICRSVVNSENAIHRLNNKVGALARCCRKTSAQITIVAVAGLMLTALVAVQDKEIRALQKKVADLETKNTGTTEEQTEQKGA